MNRDRGDNFKVVGLKNLAKTKKHYGSRLLIYHALAPYRIYPRALKNFALPSAIRHVKGRHLFLPRPARLT